MKVQLNKCIQTERKEYALFKSRCEYLHVRSMPASMPSMDLNKTYSFQMKR